MDLSPEACYQAVTSRDRRFDGRFFTGVRTTGIYCRPGCPARTPHRRNVRFFASAAAAELAGLRPCKKCKPDAAPGTPWSATSATVARALGAISEGALDDEGMTGLATRLGVTDRHLRRMFHEELGASPRALGLARRVHFARTLLDATELPVTRIALASGFRSIRAFNEAFRRSFQEAPTERRAKRRSKSPVANERIRLELAFRPPLAWDQLLGFLAGRAIPGVERVVGGVYERTFEVGKARGVLSVRLVAERNAVLLELPASAAPELLAIAERVRRLFDLRADPLAIGEHLARDPLLAARVRAVPGLRVPGAFEPFELGVRAILGQQVTVAGATTLSGRVAALYGEPLEGGHRTFPTAEVLAEVDFKGVGLPRARAETIRAFARAYATGAARLKRGVPFETAIATLEAIPGIGPWTAHSVALRALGEPDAFPASDLELRKQLTSTDGRPTPRQVLVLAERWRPWRAYAALYLWSVR